MPLYKMNPVKPKLAWSIYGVDGDVQHLVKMPVAETRWSACSQQANERADPRTWHPVAAENTLRRCERCVVVSETWGRELVVVA